VVVACLLIAKIAGIAKIENCKPNFISTKTALFQPSCFHHSFSIVTFGSLGNSGNSQYLDPAYRFLTE
jgi:hypothetical protein